MGDERFVGAGEVPEKILDQRADGGLPAHERLEDMRVADFFRPAHRALFFQPVDDGLHRGVFGAAVLRQVFLNLADRAGAEFPEGAEQFQLEARGFEKLGGFHLWSM